MRIIHFSNCTRCGQCFKRSGSRSLEKIVFLVFLWNEFSSYMVSSSYNKLTALSEKLFHGIGYYKIPYRGTITSYEHLGLLYRSIENKLHFRRGALPEHWICAFTCLFNETEKKFCPKTIYEQQSFENSHCCKKLIHHRLVP